MYKQSQQKGESLLIRIIALVIIQLVVACKKNIIYVMKKNYRSG